MKKTYITPTQKVADLDLQALICDSPQPYNEIGNNDWYVQEERSFGSKSLWDSEW